MTDETKAPADGSNEEIRRAKERRGVVIAANTAKTVTVEVVRRVQHAQYGKYMTRRRTYAVHDLVGCKVGDHVLIRETRPLSKMKRWRVVEKVTAQGGQS
jgi:small subunit ribosomal protein S17